jgi:F0F1-type ATP synthase membrane subunit b/b'
MIKESILRSNKEYENQINTIKKQITNMQIKAERNITEYKKSLEKDIEKSALSLSAVILSKLNYKNSNAKQINEKLSKFSMSDDV